MDQHHTRIRSPTAGAPVSPFRRFISRRPTLTAVTIGLATLGAGFKYVSLNLRRNEQAQKLSAGSSFYVPVERSGGGI